MKIVVALGGNALGNTPEEQIEILDKNMGSLAKLIKDGHELVIAHGNGPQVGIIQDAFVNQPGFNLGLPEATAMSQGYIAYHIQQVLNNHTSKLGLNKNIVSILTQVKINPKAKEFDSPSKPIGRFFSKKEAHGIMKNSNIKMKEDSGRGYRKVVASPKPIDIIEKEIISYLVEEGTVVIASGGGGIPVYETDEGNLKGIDAVVDKDFSAAKLADLINADTLIILTAVSEVKRGFMTDREEVCFFLNENEAKTLIEERELGEGSMLPKVEAALDFISSNPNRTAIITSFDQLEEALAGRRGTKISV